MITHPENANPEHENADRTRSEIAALKSQVFTLLMALIVISGTLTIFLYRQASLAGSDLAQAQKLGEMVTQNEAALGGFLSKLVAFGKTHPDFQRVLKKYGVTEAPAPVAAPKK